MNFIKHPDPTMGIYTEQVNDLFGGRTIEWAFPITDDERSEQYLAWLEEQDFNGNQ